MGRRVSRAVRRVVRGVSRAVDSVTGDILDLDGSKQKEQIEAMRKAEEEALRREQERIEAEKKYQQDVANSKDQINKGDGLTEDKTGVGLTDVNIDFTKSLTDKTDEDRLKKMLRRK